MATFAPSTTWKEWVTYPSWHYTTGTWATATTTTNLIWDNWTTGTTTSANIILTPQGITWNAWQEMPHRYVYTPLPAPTPEELAAIADRQQAAREERSRRELAEKQRMAGAQDRAMELLLTVLTAEERAWYDEHDEFLVRGQSGRMYVIDKRGVHGNIRETDEHGCFLGRVCVAPGMYDYEAGFALPLADGWLGQYLGLKHSEDLIRARGNWSGVAVCTRPEASSETLRLVA